jgi:hypothetical protein
MDCSNTAFADDMHKRPIAERSINVRIGILRRIRLRTFNYISAFNTSL